MLPKNLIIVRHGQSEANVFQSGVDSEGRALKVPAEFTSRHDSNMRLSPKGSQQARTAGDWLRAHDLANFERFYVSPHTRTRETAGHLHLGGQWRVDDRWRERDWGELAALSKKQQKERFPESMLLKEQNEWYWKPAGGESLATGVRARFTAIMDMLYRKNDDGNIADNVVAVAHGELIRVAAFVIEQMTPDQWLRMDADPAYKVQNCMVVHYSRTNPHTGEESKNFTWRRAICPWDDTLSWDNGEWTELKHKLYSDEELLNTAREYARFF
jgi:broad specificity phosphatase PhoE